MRGCGREGTEGREEEGGEKRLWRSEKAWRVVEEAWEARVGVERTETGWGRRIVSRSERRRTRSFGERVCIGREFGRMSVWQFSKPFLEREVGGERGDERRASPERRRIQQRLRRPGVPR